MGQCSFETNNKKKLLSLSIEQIIFYLLLLEYTKYILARRLQQKEYSRESDVISLIIMTENEDETLKWNEWQCDGRKDVIKWNAPRRSGMKKRKNSRWKHQQIHSKYICMLLYIIAIRRMKFYGHRLCGTERIFCWLLNCFRMYSTCMHTVS